MFNLTVAEAHTFYVGANGWLVHNSTGSSKLGKSIGAVSGDKLQNHHLIPSELRDHPFIQRAGDLWDHDYGIDNGRLIPDNMADALTNKTLYHNTSHTVYNQIMEQHLNDLEQMAQQRERLGNPMSQAEVAQELRDLAKWADELIEVLPCGTRLP